MKKFLLLCIPALLMLGCGVNRQFNLKAFEKSRYEITSADSIYLANVRVSELVGKEDFQLIKMPRIALALLRKDVPLRARVNLAIENPTSSAAALNEFEYKVLLKNRELANGFVNQKISVGPNSRTVVPIHINSNIYHLLSDEKVQDAIADFIAADPEKRERKSSLTIKIRPTLGIGNKKIKYPGYITIDKEISSKILL
ncbi:LEA type 2 family protein [Pedobacter sp. SYSU D00535]|uniref:LEA type 2 family protein n=1 Tax=Pedobacter sp. SYSU D00535 TaxID=2810308 RepID=UPI001A979C7B|nr:LEA type 2 family protein [Pedobacter sp. SYSU D00535]